jgi:zinc D-Ala-D-Ala carboxypeptidase
MKPTMLNIKLTPHFTLAELTASSTAQRLRLDNQPGPDALRHLQGTAEMLERIRSTLSAPIVITSAYRGPQVNRAVGGVSSSDHMTGQAADIVSPSFGSPYLIAKTLAPLVQTLGIGQLILEGIKGKQWVHVSTRIPDKPSNRVITITDAGARMGIQVLV